MSSRASKYFPIKTATSCRTKWAWSTIHLTKGTTSSCCKASTSEIGEDFDNFHNTKKKIQSRQIMLEGRWPGDGCQACENIELSGGFSDRQLQNQIPEIYPIELDSDPTAVEVSPSILEVFFSNTCNLKCVYCSPQFSSAIQAENIKFNGSILPGMNFEYIDNQYQTLVPKFWKWFSKNSQMLQRLQLLGGEPFLQKDVLKVIDYLNQTPHSDLELNIVTNLSIPTAQLSKTLLSLSDSKKNNSIKRIDIQASVDSWGAEQEYVRYGFDSELFENNMLKMISLDSFRIGLLSTVNSLSINAMPDLCKKYLEWNKLQPVFWYMHLVRPIDSVLNPLFFEYSVFEQSINRILEQLPNETWDDKLTYDTFAGIAQLLEKKCSNDVEQQTRLVKYLTENDRRRNTDWKKTFPWLVNVLEKNNVV
jgi:organic radical activating enzyme